MPTQYQFIPVSTTDAALGTAGGRAGDLLDRVILIPASVAYGDASLKDGGVSLGIIQKGTTGTTAYIFERKQTVVKFGMRSVNGGWKLTTPAGLTAIAIGDFY